MNVSDDNDIDEIADILEAFRLKHGIIDENENRIVSQLARSEKLKMCTLKEYGLPTDVLEIEKNKKFLGGATSKEIAAQFGLSTLDKSTESGYLRAFTKMLQFEEAAQSQFVSQFNAKGIQLTHPNSESEREFCIKNDSKVAALIEAVEESAVDCFTLKPSNPLIGCGLIAGQIKTCNKEFIFVEITERDHCMYLSKHPDRCYDIFFHVNRVTFQLQHYALEWIANHQLFNIFVNSSDYDCDASNFNVRAEPPDTEENYAFRGELAPKLNAEQKSAAINIIQARNQPLPYLLFGPAGTGKTRTLVAAIEEIVRTTSKSVLVCANSNAACDEITMRLVNVLQDDEMFRMYGKSYDIRKVNEKIKPISNWLKGEFRFPSLTFLYQFRVLVCTLTTAGCLTRSTDNSAFSSEHFSHIIIDESASAHETVSLIPIAGLCTSLGQINSSVVLAGDPKQLDAVTKSDYSIQLGFRTSLMERLFERRLYKRDSTTGQYNQRYITQLVKNYRSHPAILAIPNQLFYDDKLEAKASKDITDLYIGSQLLPSKNFPIIFKTVRGICKKSNKDFSMFNMKEVDVVIDYIRKLLAPGAVSITQSDIGIVTPYKLQCKIIARECRKNNFKDVTIGTAEVFQGQERPVMIVSTVRSDGQLGFVKNPRRLNVIVTRAKSLLIIVGDYKTLATDSNWHKLIYHCYEHNAVVS